MADHGSASLATTRLRITSAPLDPPRLARAHHLPVAQHGLQPLDQSPDLGRLAGALAAFEAYETSTGHGRTNGVHGAGGKP